jgi:hypothetical protein
VLRAVARSFLFCLVVLFIASTACAQDSSFNPRYDGLEDEKGKAAAAATVAPPQGIYSFARFNYLFKALCEGLEAEGRRARVFEVSKAGLQQELDCTPCRAFYRQLIQTCAPPRWRWVQATPTPSPTPIVAEEGDELPTPEPTVPQPTPTPTPVGTPPARYPSAAVLDVASRLSVGLYEMDPGEGSPLQAVKSFEARIFGIKELTPGERDYFGVLSAYLLSAWAGREKQILEPKALEREDIADLFQ